MSCSIRNNSRMPSRWSTSIEVGMLQCKLPDVPSCVCGVAGNKTTLIPRYLMWSGGNCKDITLLHAIMLQLIPCSGGQ